MLLPHLILIILLDKKTRTKVEQNNIMLTAKQLKLLEYLQQSFKENSVSPSFEEMKLALGLKSKSGIHRLISALEERGFIHKRLHNKARAINILSKDHSTSKNAQYHEAKKFKVYGQIAAGTPLEAIETPERFMKFHQK